MMSYTFAKMHGFAYVLSNKSGRVKAVGNDRRTLAYSRQCRKDDAVLTLDEYHRKYPGMR